MRTRVLGLVRAGVRVALAALAAALALAPRPAGAQELSFALGRTVVNSTREASYGWQLDYRQAFAPRWSWSVTYLNEGHPTGHHRDGLAAQAWYRAWFLDRRLWASVGLGAYRSYDTDVGPDGASRNVHDLSPIVSASATWYTRTPWFVRGTINRVHVRDGLDTRTYLLGAGYRLFRGKDPLPGDGGARESRGGEPGGEVRRELTVFAGSTTVNTFQSEKAVARGWEYRRSVARYVDWTVTWLNEGGNTLIRRNGAASQAWYGRDFAGGRMTLGLGGGIYYNLDRRRTPAPGEKARDVAGLVTMTASWRPDPRWSVRLYWNRIVTDYSRDTDVFALGLGRIWQRASE